MSFVVIKSSLTDLEKDPSNSRIKWYHTARKRYEIVEITQMSRRTFEEIKKEFPDAFEEHLHGVAPAKFTEIKGVFEKPTEERVVRAKPVPVAEESKYKCSDCQLPSASIGGIRRHITKMHGKGKAEVIDIATGEIIKDEPEEVTKESAPIEEESEDFKFKCESCGLKTPSLGGVRRHITKMHGKGACKVIDLATNLPIEEEANDDAPPAFQVSDEKAKEVAVEEPPQAEVAFTRPKPVKRDF